jgi:LruC domain-containing protein
MKSLILSTLLFSSTVLMADFNSADDTNWHYLLKTYNEQGGILDEDLTSPLHTIDQEILDTLSASLPEWQKNHLTHPEYFPSKEPELVIGENAETFVTFYSEGAGYRNALGFYTYDGDTNRTRPTSLDEIRANGVLIYPNASAEGKGGTLKYGTTVSLGKLSAGTKVLFFLVSDGWRPHWQPENIEVSLNNEAGNTKEDWIFSSWSSLNKEYDANSTLTVPNHKHVAMLWDEVKTVDGQEGRILLMGFEDIGRDHGACDHDFNDVLFSVSTSPMAALQEEGGGFAEAPPVLDHDFDGVNDVHDAYPEDPERAYNSYYPSATGAATLAYEDMWPREGDYDMNDVTVKFAINEIKDASYNVKEIVFEGVVQAHGAAYTDGFAIKLDTPLSNIERATVDDENVTLKADSDGNAIIYVIDDVSKSQVNGTDIGHMYNVFDAVTPAVLPDTFRLNIVLKDAQKLMAPPYNPFITVNNGTYHNIEVHLPNFMPTAYADDLFGTRDDDSNLTTGKTYMTADNKPWALLIPEDFAHPIEYNNIAEVYFHYNDWVQSAGTAYVDWYLYAKVDSEGKYADTDKVIVSPNVINISQ